MSLLQTVEDEIVNTLTIAVKNTGKDGWDINTMSEYRRGFLHGYGDVYRQLTGYSIYILIEKINARLEGSGHKITV